MITTPNFEFKKIELSDSPPDITVPNSNWDTLDATLQRLDKFETARGTGTAITLTNVSLVNGACKTFIVLANNNGAPTTINGKSLYKPGGTVAPTLVAGKAVTVWYNGTNFFIKASAEGSAVASNVLAGKTFSNDSDIGIVGTMQSWDNYGYELFQPKLVNNGLVFDVIEPLNGYANGIAIYAGIDNCNPATVCNGIPVNDGNGDTIFTGTFTADGNLEASKMLVGQKGYSKGIAVQGGMQSISPDYANQILYNTIDCNAASGDGVTYLYVGNSNLKSKYNSGIDLLRVPVSTVMDIMKNKGIGGRKASGTLTSGTSTSLIHPSKAWGSWDYGIPISVNGLSFTPSLVKLRWFGGYAMVATIDDNGEVLSVRTSNQMSCPAGLLYGTGINLFAGGFNAVVDTPNASITWQAWE